MVMPKCPVKTGASSFQQDNEMRNIVMTDKDARDQATRHFFKRAQRQALI